MKKWSQNANDKVSSDKMELLTVNLKNVIGDNISIVISL